MAAILKNLHNVITS